MWKRFLIALAVISAVAASQARGQTPAPPLPNKGTLEVGLFAQYTHFDAEAGCPCERPLDAWGWGGRVGYFVSRPWELEADAVFSKPERAVVGGKTDYTAYAVRLNYNVVPSERFSMLAGAGAVLTRYHKGHSSEWGPSGIIGARAAITPRLDLRVDGVADYMPGTKNLNLAGRIGLSLFIGGERAEEVIPTPVPIPAPAPIVATPVAPAPAPAPPPAPVPAPAVDTTQITAPIYFDYDRSAIRADAEAILERKLPWLRANPGMRIRIEGNADVRGSDEYNVALSKRRAGSASRWLIDHGISADRITTVGWGEERQVCSDQNESCWQQNRRDDFIIVTVGADRIIIPE